MADMQFLESLDLNGREIKDVRAEGFEFAALPSAAANERRIVYDTTNKAFLYSNGSEWVNVNKTNIEILGSGKIKIDGTEYTYIGSSGDVTADVNKNLQIGANKVTNAKLAKMPAKTVKGNKTAEAATPTDITISDLKGELNLDVEVTGNADEGYTIKQGGVILATINLPKDKVISAGEVVTGTLVDGVFTPNEGGIKYLRLTVANADEAHKYIYIRVSDLVDVYTAANATGAMVLVTISSDNKVSADLSQATKSEIAKIATLEARTETDNNFTDELKTKLEGIAAGAEVNVQSDWNETSTTSDAYIKNKPSIPAAAKDGILTIKAAGVNKGTFSANQATNVEIDITTEDLGLSAAAKYYKTGALTGTTGTITAATHGCGKLPQVQAYLAGEQVFCSIKVNSQGTVTWTSSIAMTASSDFRLVIVGGVSPANE